MRINKYLTCIVLFIVCAKDNGATKSYGLRQSTIEQDICRNNYALTKSGRSLLNVNDVWLKIRESVIDSWDYLKLMAEKTTDQISVSKENLKEYANQLKYQFEEKLEEIKSKLNNIIGEIYGAGELVKECIRDEQENIKEVLKEILVHFSECIAEEINQFTTVSRVGKQRSEIRVDDAKFIKELDEKANLCQNNVGNVVECLCKVREGIFDNITVVENDVLKNQVRARSMANDIKGSLVTCSINSLKDATNLISAVIIEIAKCVVDKAFNFEVYPVIDYRFDITQNTGKV